MIVFRCPQCSCDMEIAESENSNEYREVLSGERCAKCLSQPISVEEKILATIFGRKFARDYVSPW